MNKFFATAAMFLALATPAFANDDCEVNLDQYDKLKIGMSLKEVVNVLGCDGNMTFSSKAASYKVEIVELERHIPHDHERKPGLKGARHLAPCRRTQAGRKADRADRHQHHHQRRYRRGHEDRHSGQEGRSGSRRSEGHRCYAEVSKIETGPGRSQGMVPA